MAEERYPTLPPKRPYRLSEMDRRFLKAMRIQQDEDKEVPDVLPHHSQPQQAEEESSEDGA